MPAGRGQTPSGRVEAGRLLRSAGTVGGITALSRVFGYVRDMVVALLLGTSMEADAWRVAFMLPNTLRRVVGEGNLSAAFIPVFAQLSHDRDEDEVRRLADRFFTAAAGTVTLLTLAGIAAAPWLVRTFAPGFADIVGKTELTTQLARGVFPYLLFISLAAVLMAVLNARERFAAAAFTPVLFNIAIVAVALSLAGHMAPVWAVAVGAVLGGAIQWLFLVPFAWREGMRFRPLAFHRDPALRRIGRLLVPGLFGVGIVQINVLIGTLLASTLSQGSVASLYYAGRLNELALGIFAISVATVVLPTMSRQAAVGHVDELRETLGFALRHVSLIVLPASVGLFVLRHPIVSVLYERGQFDETSTALTTAALWGYSIGLMGYAAVRILAPCFFSLQDTRTPVVVAGIALVANVVGCLVLMGPLENAGIALANSIAGFLSAGLLLILLRRRLGRIGGRRIGTSVLRHAGGAAAMGVVVVFVGQAWPPIEAGSLLLRVLSLLTVITSGIVAYGASLALMRAPELAELAGILRRQPTDPGEPARRAE